MHGAFIRFLDVVDPYPGPRRNRLTADELNKVLESRDPKKMAVKKQRLDELTHSLLHATFLMIPRDVRRKWKGNTCIDAGWYYRAGNHSEAEKEAKDKGRIGWEIHIITMVANAPSVAAEFPLLILGSSSDTPSGRIAENALAALNALSVHFTSTSEHGSLSGYVMGDRAYFAGTKAEKLQIPLRQLGFDILMDYKSNQLRLQAAMSLEPFKSKESGTAPQ